MNVVEIVVTGTDRSQAALARAAASAKRTGAEIGSAQARVETATKQAAEAAKRAGLDVQAAAIRVEKAEAAAAAAAEKFGAESLQAREAASNLARAQDAQARAAGKAAEAERDAATAGERVAKADRDAAEATAQATRKKQADAAASAASSRAKKDAAAASTAERAAAREASAAEDEHAASLHRLGGALAAAGLAAKVAMVGGLLAVGAAALSTLKVGMDYQSQLNMMQAVTHATGAEMQAVAKRARDLGNDLTLPATSAADAAHAMTELAKGNLTAKQAMDAAKGTLQLAAAAQIDGATAATIQADALNAFSLKATMAGHVADVLANAANNATGEISDFALGLGQSSAVAHQFGLSVDQTVTALALFANAGIHGADAGTSLKSALLALASPSKQAADALKVLNLHAFDAKGRFVGLESISQQLATAQGRLSQQTFAAATSTAFGSDAARAAGVLASAGAVGWDKMAASISKSGGAAGAAQARMKGVGGALAGIKSELETIQIDVFTAAAPAIERFLHWVADLIPRAISNMGAGFHSAAEPVNAFSKGLMAVEEGLKPIGKLLPGLNTAFKPIGAVFDHLGGSGGALAKGLAPIGKALDGIGAAGKGAAQVFTNMAPMIGETADLMGSAVRPIGPLIKATGDSATRSGLEQFFFNVGKGVANLILFVRRNADTWKEWAGKVADAARGAGKVIKGIIDFGQELRKYGGWIAPIAVGIGAAVVAFKAWAAVTRIVAAAQAALDIALAANPVGIVVLAVIALTAAFVVAWKHSETFRNVVKTLGPILIPIILGIVSPVLGIAAALIIAWKQSEKFRDVVTGAFRAVASHVLEAAQIILDGVLGMVIGVLHAAGRMPGPLGAPFRAAEKEVRNFRDSADRQMRLAQARIQQWGREAAKPIRKDVTIRVVDKATGVITTITRELDQLSGRAVSVQVGAVRGPGARANEHGGIIGADTGGARGGLTWVGESGRELVRLPYGSTVYPHGQSEGMAAAAAGGGGQQVVFQVQPGGTGLDRMFIDWLREAVRGRGGVDVVFPNRS